MTTSLLFLWGAATALVAFGTSALIGLGLAALGSKLQTLTPRAEARLLLWVALLPLLVCVASMGAVLAPSLGWIVDHCADGTDLHLHPHICVAHHVDSLPALTLLGLAGFLALRVTFFAARLVGGTVRAALAVRTLKRNAVGRARGFWVLPLDEPQAFVVGLLFPRMFVTRGLTSGAHRPYLRTVLAHERAHVERRDPLRRIFAALGLAFHLPGLAGWLERRLARAHEMAADRVAARVVGSAELVAQALVRLARAQLAPSLALAFAATEVELRVRALLDDRARHEGPPPAVFFLALAAVFIALGSSADGVHHGLEIVLGVLGG